MWRQRSQFRPSWPSIMIPIFATARIVICVSMQPLWICPGCGRGFANRNQSHFCSNVRLEDHFKGRDPQVVATFDALLTAAKKSGPLEVLPEKTRVAFQVRM